MIKILPERITDRKIKHGDKIIICLGDSFTQGQGSWDRKTWKRYGNRISPQKLNLELLTQMYQNSWPRQLVKNHLLDYVSVNLGVVGQGNRAAVKELYLHPELKFHEAKKGIVILMLSGLERWDFIDRNYHNNCHFDTIFPYNGNEKNKLFWKLYSENVISDKFSFIETILNIKEVEIYCKAYGYNLIITSAFEQRITKDFFLKKLGENFKDLVDSLPWDNFLFPQGCKSFIELLLINEGRPELAAGDWYAFYSVLKEPSKYITNCTHPTYEGYSIIAEEIFKFMQDKGFLDE